MTADGTASAVQRVVVVYEPGRAGAAALMVARELAELDSATLTVLGVAPQATTKGGCCGTSSAEYNSVVRDVTLKELQQARERLGAVGDRATFKMLVEGSDPPLHEWIGADNFDVVLLPARRRLLRSATHPAASRLQLSHGGEVRVVDPKAQPAARVDTPRLSSAERLSA